MIYLNSEGALGTEICSYKFYLLINFKHAFSNRRRLPNVFGRMDLEASTCTG